MGEIKNVDSNGKWKESIHAQLDALQTEQSFVCNLIRQLNALEGRFERLRIENACLTSEKAMGAEQNYTSSSGGDPQAVKIQRLEHKVYEVQEELTSLHRAKSSLSDQLVAVTTGMQEKEAEVQQNKNRVTDLESELMLLKEDCERKKEDIEQLTTLNNVVRDEYNTLNMTYEALNGQFLELKKENAELVARWILYKSKDADRLNAENDQHYQLQRRVLEASLEEAAKDFNAVVLPSSEECARELALGTLVCPCSVVPTNCFFSLETHDADLHTLRVSHHGRLLATGGEDRKLKLWNIARDGFTYSQMLMGSNAGINSIDFSPDDSLIMAASTDYASRIWSIQDLRIRHTLTGHSAKVMACKFVNDVSKVITGGHDRTIKIWDLRSKACSRTIFVGSSCNDLDLPKSSPSLVFSGHHDRKLRIYDLRANNEATSVVDVVARVTSVSLFNNSHSCLVSCRDNTLRVVDIRTNAVLTEFVAEGLQLGSDSTRACVSPDDSYVAVGSSDGSMHVWNADTAALESALPAKHTSCVVACSWTPDGQAFLSCERSKQVKMWSHI